MKVLHLIRHAKSSWVDESLADHDRPLFKTGVKACHRIGKKLFQEGCRFEHIYCSSALRAQQTIKHILDTFPKKQREWKTDSNLYTFSSGELWRWIHSIPDAEDSVLIVGHNPAFTQFVNSVANADLGHLPTCGYVRLMIPSTWQDLNPGDAKVEAKLFPKMLSAL